MSYGLDFSEVRYETDHDGKRIKATIPYPMFSALVEFWIAARRAQSARAEATTRPGQYKASIPQVFISSSEADHVEPIASEALPPAPPNRTEAAWTQLMVQMKESCVPLEIAELEVPPPPSVKTRAANRFFFTQFLEAPPDEVLMRIEQGVYYLRAWREYRGFTVADAAELLKVGKATIQWHEAAKNLPREATLRKFAEIYDCSLEQLTPKPETVEPLSVQGFEAPKLKRSVSEPRSSADTDYPDAVLAHLLSGKSPMLAWRLYRGLTIRQLAEAYGAVEYNIKAMEEHAWLRPKTIDKLCPIFHCRPEQLLRPLGMPSCDAAGPDPRIVRAVKVIKTIRERRREEAPPPPPAMEEAFGRASVSETTGTTRRKKTQDRLVRMQKELAA
jgi:transcriptional regulator with XRE-family HTH domain/DNA-binding Xre family transcriptional regulator